MISLLLVCSAGDEIADVLIRTSSSGDPVNPVQLLRPPTEPSHRFHAIVFVGRASVHIVDAAVASGIPFAWIMSASDIAALTSPDRSSRLAAEWTLANATLVLAPSAEDAARIAQGRELSPPCEVLSLGPEGNSGIAASASAIRALVKTLVESVMDTDQPGELSGDVLQLFDSLAAPVAPPEDVRIEDTFPQFVLRVPEPFTKDRDFAAATIPVPLTRDWYRGLPLGRAGKELLARLVAQAEAAERFVCDWHLSGFGKGQAAFGECPVSPLGGEPRRVWRLADLRFNEERLG